MKKHLISYYFTSPNNLRIPGTDEIGDWKINLNFLPKDGVHRGIKKAVDERYEEIKAQLDKRSPVRIKAHSLGGAFAQRLAELLVKDGFIVNLETQGAYGIYRKNYHIPYIGTRLFVKCRRYGRDPVPKVFPFYKTIVPSVPEGRKKAWWRIAQHFSDHLRYWLKEG